MILGVDAARQSRPIIRGAPLALLLAASVALPLWSQAPTIRLDHVVVVVRDLSLAATTYRGLGFRIKPGRLHPDSLLNCHIKLRDGGDIELMTLAGSPLDADAADYARLLAQEEGGAYVALKVTDLAPVATAAARVGLETRISASGGWRFLSFPGNSDASGVFFGSGWTNPADPDSVLSHPNGAVALTGAWVRGGPRLEALLRSLGTIDNEESTLPDGSRGRRWRLGKGSLVVLPRGDSTNVPRPIAIELGRRADHEAAPVNPVRTHDGLWLMFTPDSTASPEGR
ncbi:MAG TPA: VOC family protein [Gemmatimonadales bacterium]|nr:VOC family protein [Gemmatimonadales bacterium]